MTESIDPLGQYSERYSDILCLSPLLLFSPEFTAGQQEIVKTTSVYSSVKTE